jgi:hypothetical protein
MFQFKHDFEDYFCGERDLDAARQLNPDLRTFEQWLEENASKITVDG